VSHSSQCVKDKICIEPCELTIYSYTMFAEKIDPNIECLHLRKTNFSISTYPIAHRLLHLRDLITSNKREWEMLFNNDLRLECLLSMKGSSVVHIKPATGRINVISQRKTSNLGNQMAQFGKNCIALIISIEKFLIFSLLKHILRYEK